jgi:hypothetical protein
VVTSNGVLNLVPDKPAAFGETSVDTQNRQLIDTSKPAIN